MAQWISFNEHIIKSAHYHIITANLNQMNKVATYFRESYKELIEKVSWPNWSELQQSTVIVLVATLLITFVIGIMDIISSSLLHLIYSFFS
jgi:preprotein translocase subunit SecE